MLKDEKKEGLLFAAKPVSWKGRSDLPQVAWASSLKGTWLVIDLWAGVSGLCMMLLQLGVHFYAVAAEFDAEAVSVSRSNMPNIVHVDRVEDLSAKLFVPFLRRRQCRGIILGGGSPSQPNSSLNADRQGLEDPRSQQAYHIARLRQELEALPEAQELQIVSFLENVATCHPRFSLNTLPGFRPTLFWSMLRRVAAGSTPGAFIGSYRLPWSCGPQVSTTC